MVIFFLAIASSIVVLMATLRWAPDDPDGMAAHLPTLGGGVFVLGSFMLFPWISFAFLNYVAGAPGMIAETAPKALGFLLHLLGQEGLAALLGLLEKFGAIPGWLLPFIVASFSGLRHGFALLLGPAVSSISLIWLTIHLITGSASAWRRRIGWLQAGFAALAWALLLLEIPRIDAIGSHPNFAAHFFVVVSGARMTGWVWFAWVGLLLLAIGGLLEARGVFHQ